MMSSFHTHVRVRRAAPRLGRGLTICAGVVRQPNVTLQSLVYFNILYSIAFAVVMFATLLYRVRRRARLLDPRIPGA